MLSILLITSHQRLQEIVSEAASAGNASLRIAPALGECATEIAGTAPDLIFIQNRLSGLSADILIRHVKSLLAEEASVRIVLLCESLSDPLDELFIDTTGTDEEVRAAVDRVINAEHSHVSPQQQATPHSDSSGAASHVDSSPFHPTATLAEDEAPVPDVADAVSVSGADTSLDSDDRATGSTPPLKFHEELDTLMGTPVVPPQNDHQPPLSGPTVEELLRRPSKPRRKIGAAALALGVAVAAGIALYQGEKENGKPAVPTAASAKVEKAVSSVAPTPPPPATTPAPEMQKPVTTAPPSSQVPTATMTTPQDPGIRKTALPSFIPKNAFVQRKGATNGEWEKYVSPAAEYRVFREGSKIKAVQVIDRTGKGITRAFFTRAIYEMAGVRDYSLQSRVAKGDILVKKGTLSGSARVILYKRNADTFLQAFVIQYD